MLVKVHKTPLISHTLIIFTLILHITLASSLLTSKQMVLDIKKELDA